MASRDDGGQIILLAGILLVIAFIVFSINLASLANLGQQVGRETENPLLDDYLLVRRALETSLVDELRTTGSGTPQVACPDLSQYANAVVAQLMEVQAHESMRGQAFDWADVTLPQPTLQVYTVQVTTTLSDGVTTAVETLSYKVTCTTTVPSGLMGGGPGGLSCTRTLRPFCVPVS